MSLKTLALAGLTRCDMSKTADWIETRGTVAPSGRVHYDKLASWTRRFVRQDTPREDLVKLAGAVGELDELYGLTEVYGKKLPTPQETVFNTKTAMGPSVDMAGTDVPLSELMAVDPEVYGDVLGSDVVGEITEDGELAPERIIEIFATLPRDLKQLVVAKLSL